MRSDTPATKVRLVAGCFGLRFGTGTGLGVWARGTVRRVGCVWGVCYVRYALICTYAYLSTLSLDA